MEKKYPLLLISALLAVSMILPARPAGRSQAPAATDFPEKLLDGIDTFDSAVFRQGDLRCDFDHCG